MNRATRQKVTDEAKKGSLGIRCSERYQSVYEGTGAFVEEVIEGGAADKAGIMAYDIITAIDGVKVTSWNELLSWAHSSWPTTVWCVTSSRSHSTTSRLFR